MKSAILKEFQRTNGQKRNSTQGFHESDRKLEGEGPEGDASSDRDLKNVGFTKQTVERGRSS